MKKNLEELKEEVDQIDLEIQSLFAKRMLLEKEALAIKKEKQLPIIDSSREQEIKESILRNNDIIIRKYYPEVNEALLKVSNIYQNELAISKDIYEKTIRICYFGKGKSNTYLGLKEMLLDDGCKQINDFSFFKGDEQIILTDSASMDDLRTQLFRKQVDLAFVPFANSDMGVVMDTYRLLARYNFIFVKKTTAPIVLYLYTSKANNKRINSLYDIKNIYSNLAALNQCSNFVNKHLPFAAYKKSISTTSSLDDMLNDTHNIAVCFANAYANENENVEKVKLWEATTSNNQGTKTTYLLLKRFDSPSESLPKQENIEEYFTGYYLYLSKNKKGKGFSVDAKSHRVVKIERKGNHLELSVYIVSQEKNTWIAFSDEITVYVDENLRQICFEYVYRSAPGIKEKVNGTAYLRASENDLQDPSTHIFGEYKGLKNGKAGTLDFRRITKEEFDVLMGN